MQLKDKRGKVMFDVASDEAAQAAEDPRWFRHHTMSAKSGQSILVWLQPTKAMVVEPYSLYAPLGRFAVRDMKKTVAVGVITMVQPKNMVKGGEEPSPRGKTGANEGYYKFRPAPLVKKKK